MGGILLAFCSRRAGRRGGSATVENGVHVAAIAGCARSASDFARAPAASHDLAGWGEEAPPALVLDPGTVL